MIRPSSAVALALLATVSPSAARADAAPGEHETTEQAPPSSSPPLRTAPGLRPFDTTTLRLALLGDYRRLIDLSALGGAVAFAVGRATDRSGGQFELRAGAGRTSGGLSTLEVGVGANGEVTIVDGAFLGVGAGLALFGVKWATDGGEHYSVGPEVYGRAGYRFGKHAAPFVAVDMDLQLHAGGSVSLATGVWGPTFAVGYTF